MPTTRIGRVVRFEREPLLRWLGRKQPRSARQLAQTSTQGATGCQRATDTKLGGDSRPDEGAVSRWGSPALPDAGEGEPPADSRQGDVRG